MTTYDTFEVELATALRDYVRDAPTDVDALATAHRVAGAQVRRPLLEALRGLRRRYVWLLLGALLALLILAALAIGLRPALAGSGLLAFARDGNVYLADTDIGRTVLAVDEDVEFAVDGWSPDGRWLLVEAEDRFYLLDPATLEIRALPGQRPSVGFTFESWSPDARQVLLSAVGDECCGHLVDVASGTERVIGPDYMCMGVFSPDGRWIAAVSGAQLTIIDVESGEWERIGSFEGVGCGATQHSGWDAPTWSADSERVAFLGDGGALTVVSRHGDDPVTIASELSGWVRPLWSPDGEWIAYRQSTGLHVVRPDATGSQLVAVGGIDYHRIAWNADGKSITFGRPADDGFEPPTTLFTVDIESGAESKLLEAGPFVGSFARQPTSKQSPAPTLGPGAPPSPRGSPLVPATPASGESVDPASVAAGLAWDTWNGGPPCQPVVHWFAQRRTDRYMDFCSDRTAAGWSADGTLYASLDESQYLEGHGTIRVLSRDRQTRSLADVAGVGDRLHWSTAGQWLVLRRCSDPHTFGLEDQHDCAPELAQAASWVIVRPDGSGYRELPGHPTWSPDDTVLAVETAGGHLLVGSGDGSDLQDIGALPEPATWAPDSTRFAYLSGGDVWIMNADGSGARNATEFGFAAAASFAAWSPDGALLAVVNGDSLRLIPADGGPPRNLLLQDLDPGTVRWSADSHQLAISTHSYQARDGVVLADVEGWKPILLAGTADAVWSPRGALVAVFSSDPTRLTGIRIYNGDASGVYEVANIVEPVTQLRWIP